MAAMTDVELRFQHLLQPIRDLTRNWEVDVATQLEEYLEELENVCISFDNGKTTMNFIEAAMLIQGSACVYSRKVEHLYLLVYQVLDLFSNKKREKLPSSLRPDGTDADATFGVQQEEFLSLDDVRDSSQASTDLRKDHQPSSVNIVPLTPMSLVPPEDVEKKDNPLFSRTRELLASRRDFRMNACTPHATGTCLLELSGPPPTHLRPGDPRGAAAAGPPSCVLGREPGSISENPVRALSFSEDEGAAGLDCDIGGGGDDMPGALEDDMEVTLVAKEHMEAQKCAPQTRRRALAENLSTHIKEVLDPWQSLDPFSDSEEKPFRKGRPFLVPHGLDDMVGGKRKRKGLRKLQDFMKWFSASYTDGAGSRKPKSKGPTFADLEMLYWKQLKQRVAAQRKLQRQEGPLWPPLCEEEPEPLEEVLRSDSEDGADDFLEHEDIAAEGPEQLGDGDMALDPPTPGSLCYADLVRRNVELFIASSQQFAQETELSQRVRRWEERMEPLLQEQEERAPFDIHSYGRVLAEGCGAPGGWHSFAALVAGQPPFEVCRYMLAALQLANDTVVELAQEPGLEQALDTMRLRLLKPPQHHDRFHALQPPPAAP